MPERFICRFGDHYDQPRSKCHNKYNRNAHKQYGYFKLSEGLLYSVHMSYDTLFSSTILTFRSSSGIIRLSEFVICGIERISGRFSSFIFNICFGRIFKEYIIIAVWDDSRVGLRWSDGITFSRGRSKAITEFSLFVNGSSNKTIQNCNNRDTSYGTCC